MCRVSAHSHDTNIVSTHQQSPEPCALEEALSGAGIGAFDVAGVMQGGWQNLMAAPMGGGALDAPGGVPSAGGVGLGVGGGDEEEEEQLALAMAMAGREVRTVPPVSRRCWLVGLVCTTTLCKSDSRNWSAFWTRSQPRAYRQNGTAFVSCDI